MFILSDTIIDCQRYNFKLNFFVFFFIEWYFDEGVNKNVVTFWSLISLSLSGQ